MRPFRIPLRRKCFKIDPTCSVNSPCQHPNLNDCVAPGDPGPKIVRSCDLFATRNLSRTDRFAFEHACLLGCEGIVSKRKVSRYRSGRSRDWVKTKNPACAAVKREAEEAVAR